MLFIAILYKRLHVSQLKFGTQNMIFSRSFLLSFYTHAYMPLSVEIETWKLLFTGNFSFRRNKKHAGLNNRVEIHLILSLEAFGFTRKLNNIRAFELASHFIYTYVTVNLRNQLFPGITNPFRESGLG